MKKIYSVILLLAVMLSSCTKDETDIMTDDNSNAPALAKTRSDGSDMVEYELLPNPYTVDVIQGVYDSYNVSKTIEPTDLYVRFLPQDSLQLIALKNDYDLELFDYPLNIELPEDAVYQDPTIPEGSFTWLYTTVKPDFAFPKEIPYEVIEACYIPAEDETISPTRGGIINVEEAAFLSLGYPLEEQEPETRGKRRPEGTIRVYDDYAGTFVPVKGVKIRCHRFIKWSTTFTDESGHYTMDSKFRFGPHYAIVFDNRKGFDIWGNWGPIARANLNMGWHSNRGHSRDINAGSFAWDWAAVNNATYDYYKMCEETGIAKPPRNLKIWVFKRWTTSSTPMLRRIVHPIGYNGNSSWKNFFINIGYGTLATVLNQMLKKVLPDITIGTGGHSYRKVYDVVNHELSHASHFSQVGSAHWAKYISYIMTYGSYGNGTGKNAELCGIGEMWGYSMGHIQEHEYYKESIVNRVYYFGSPSGWIKPHVVWDLCRKSILTKKQIYDCLVVGVDTYDRLVAKMYEKYPEKADEIEKAFTDNGITPNVPKPDTGDLTHDAFYTDKTVSSSFIFSGNNILTRNVTVTNSAKLTFRANKSVTINSPFTINQGAQLEMTCGN